MTYTTIIYSARKSLYARIIISQQSYIDVSNLGSFAVNSDFEEQLNVRGAIWLSILTALKKVHFGFLNPRRQKHARYLDRMVKQCSLISVDA